MEHSRHLTINKRRYSQQHDSRARSTRINTLRLHYYSHIWFHSSKPFSLLYQNIS